MTSADREVFMHGFTTRLIDSLERIGYDQDVLKRMFNSPASMARIEEVLGRQRTRELEAILHVERVMQRSNRLLNGNSTTRNSCSPPARSVSVRTRCSATTAVVVLSARRRHGGGARYGHKYGTTRLADEIGRLLASNDQGAIRRGIALAARNDRIMDNLRNWTGAGTSKAAAPQTTNVLGPSAGKAASAEDEPVPGPKK
jgi:hypothetical protein